MLRSGDWQKSYTRDATSGEANFYETRLSLLWRPSSRLTGLFTFEGWLDRSETQQAQLFGINNYGNPPSPKDPRVLNYPLSPNNDRAADWSVCINTSPYDEPFNTIQPPYGFSPERPVTPTYCTSYVQKNYYLSGSMRLDYDLSDSLTLTSVSSYQYFHRYSPIDTDGMIYQNNETLQKGNISTLYQELRAAGKVAGRGSWIVGSNFQRDRSYDAFFGSFGNSNTIPTFGIPIGPNLSAAHKRTITYAFFGDVTYPILPALTVHGGVRYTRAEQKFSGCLYDGGSGTFSQLSYLFQAFAEASGGYPFAAMNPGPGGCFTLTGPPTFNPPVGAYNAKLDEDNVSWRAGLDYRVAPGTLLYANVSQGYKAGGFPTLGALYVTQFVPAKQEGLLAYEAGFKARLFQGAVQLNGAAFYYDYANKQILGITPTPIGNFPTLINIPKSHVFGGELSAVVRPFSGATVSPPISYAHSKIEGHFFNYDSFGELADFGGQRFPKAPELTGNVDAQYEWSIGRYRAYIGANLNYQSSTQSFLVDRQSAIVPPNTLKLPGYALLDLRAGVESGPWSLQVWGRNVTNKFYLTNAYAFVEILTRYTGMPATFGVTLSWKH